MKSNLLKSVAGFAVLGSLMVGCGAQNANNTSSSGSSADESASGAVAGAVGGTLSSSGSNGTQAYYQWKSQQSPVRGFWALVEQAARPASAMASNFCPTFATTGTGCQTSGSSMWLTYNDCTFAGVAEWTGVQEISMSSGNASCGTFPKPSSGGTLYRQIVQSAGSSTPGSAQIVADNWTATLDDASSNLDNFDGDTLSTINNGGYGAAVSFNGSGDTRSGIEIGHHISVQGVFDHTVYGSLTISETSGNSTRTVSGSVTVYHNLMRVVGTSTLSNVVHSDICCLPTEGTITTTFAAGSNLNKPPTALGQLFVGKSESLQFTGCGTAVYTSPSGTTSNVTLHRCF